MKNKIITLLMMIFFLFISYNVAELIMPKEIKAQEPPVVPGGLISYQGRPLCSCFGTSLECVCLFGDWCSIKKVVIKGEVDPPLFFTI